MISSISGKLSAKDGTISRKWEQVVEGPDWSSTRKS